MKDFIIMKTKHKGLGLFALRDFKQGERIFHLDLTKMKRYSVKEIDGNPDLNGDHADYVGHGKYVVDDSPASYMNHSCDANCYVKMKSIAIKDVYAMRDIQRGEELTHDYTATSVSQFAGMGFWIEECKCGSKNCRKVLQGDFFKMPKKWQKKYYPNLPPSIGRKYRSRFQE